MKEEGMQPGPVVMRVDDQDVVSSNPNIGSFSGFIFVKMYSTIKTA